MAGGLARLPHVRRERLVLRRVHEQRRFDHLAARVELRRGARRGEQLRPRRKRRRRGHVDEAVGEQHLRPERAVAPPAKGRVAAAQHVDARPWGLRVRADS